jgi:hypothetical protein
MGFCYAAYHFVYDLNFPVMVQVYQGDEVFQFPVAVVIEKNVPRERIVSDVPAEEESFDFCQYPTQDISVQTYDVRLAPINANVSYSCFDQECYLGQTTNGVLYAKAPACGNGILEARATGFVSSQQAFSSNKELSADIILDKEYSVDLVVKVDGKPLNGQALVSFDGSQSISTSLPDSPRISLAEGFYNVSVYVYGNSSIVIPASTNRQCTQVAQPGIFGFLGGTKEQCFDINIPETKIEQALLGGGISETYIMPSQLEKGKLVIDVSSFGQPTSLEKLQYNYEAFDQGRVFVE